MLISHECPFIKVTTIFKPEIVFSENPTGVGSILNARTMSMGNSHLLFRSRILSLKIEEVKSIRSSSASYKDDLCFVIFACKKDYLTWASLVHGI